MTSAALSCVPPPVCEPTVQCQSGCALLSTILKRHLYNREPVWFIHFGFCHVTVWIFNRNGKFLQDCRNTFHAFTLCPNITLNKGGFNRVRVQRVQQLYLYHHYICTLSFTRYLDPFFYISEPVSLHPFIKRCLLCWLLIGQIALALLKA